MKKLILLSLFIIAGVKGFAQTPITNFGVNPGNLDMYFYAPAAVVEPAPLVLVMHGCTQNATGFARESGWNTLANKYGFYIIYAEQKSANNSSQCFNWFESSDIGRGSGEAASLKSMVDYVKDQYSIDNNRVYATGFSAGGAMAAVMMATYPDVFSAGAVMSGLPYKVAISSNEAFMAMFGNINKTPQQLGNLVRNAYPSFNGDYPRLMTVHGKSDYTVYFMNERELMEQWTNVHNTDQVADQEEAEFMANPAVSKKTYKDTAGNDIVVTYSIEGMRHAIAVDPGSGALQGGQTGSYAEDANFFSSYWAAEFFGIVDESGFAAPTNVKAQANSSSAIQLTWNDNAATELSYLVERSLSSTSNFVEVAALGANATVYNDTELNSETQYFYRVTAVNIDGEKAVSSVVSATTYPSGGGGDLVVIEQPVGSGILSYTNNQSMSQSFTATASGRLETVSVNLVNAVSNAALLIYEGNTVSGQPVYEQVGITKGFGWQTITLQNTLSLISGGQYTFQITNASIKYSFSNVYSGGNFWYNSISYGVFDAAFKVEIRTTLPASALRNMKSGSNVTEHNAGIYTYPNPVSQTLYVQGNFAGNDIAVSIISSTGIVIKPLLRKHAGLLEMDVSHLNQGIYLLNMTVDGKKHFQQLVINH